MKKIKKHPKILFATLTAASIAAMSALPAFAANTVITDGTWVGSDYVDAAHAGTAISTRNTITVTNVADTSANLKVTAYQIVKGTYSDGKLTGYVLCDAANAVLADMENPTVSEIATIANNIRSNSTTLTGIRMTRGTGADANKYTAAVEAGLYVIIAEGSDSYVYNPAIVAVNIADSNAITDTTPGSVDMASYWTLPTQAYLKSSSTSFNKDIVGAETRAIVNPKNSEGDIVAKGDKIYFKLDGMVIPSYSDEYAKPNGTEEGVQYIIRDKLDGDSFDGISNFVVNSVVGTTKTPIAAVDDNGTLDDNTDDVTNYTVIFKDKNGTVVTGGDVAKSAASYELRFTDAWLRANAGKNIEVTYVSALTQDAKVNGSANKSVATLTYTVDPSNNAGVEVLRDTTYHYTFEMGGQIDANANGTTTGKVNDQKSFKSHELNKVTQAVTDVTQDWETDATTGETKSKYALAGATFTLYDDAACTTAHKLFTRNATTGEWTNADAVYTTQSDGHIVFSGLDEGTYYLKETAAPDGYTLNSNIYKVVIAGTISDGTTVAEGVLTGYTINMFVQNGANWDPCGSTVCAITPAVTEPTTDANAMNFTEVVNTTTATINPAEIVDTELATLPSTGGAGTIALTLLASVGMGGFLTLYLVNKKKSKDQ